MKEATKIAVKTTAISIAGILGFFVAFISAGDSKFFQQNALIDYSLVVAISICIGLGYLIFQILEEEGGLKEKTLASSVLKEIKKSNEKRQFHFAGLLCKGMSRPFYLEATDEERIKLGYLLITASTSLNPPDRLGVAQAKIDDIGWSLVESSQNDSTKLDKATRTINEGIQDASEVGSNYLVSKGYRHLAGIELRKHHIDEAEHFLDLAEAEACKLIDPSQQLELLAGIANGRGQARLKHNTKDAAEEALIFFKSAQEAFVELSDRERLVKAYSWLGVAYEQLENTSAAAEEYNQGLELAKQIGWPKEECRLNLQLSSLMILDNHIEEAIRLLKDAGRISKAFKLFEESEEVSKQKDRINAGKNRI